MPLALYPATSSGVASPAAFPRRSPRPRSGECRAPGHRRRPEYDPEAVIEDLDNVRIIDDLKARLSIAQQRIDDARLLWSAEAFIPTMELYGVAKVRAKKDGKLAKAIEPLADVLSTPRKKSKGDTK